MKKIFALNLLLISAAAQAQQMPYFAINNPDNNGRATRRRCSV
jgi:hypothetical protein